MPDPVSGQGEENKAATGTPKGLRPGRVAILIVVFAPIIAYGAWIGRMLVANAEGFTATIRALFNIPLGMFLYPLSLIVPDEWTGWVAGLLLDHPYLGILATVALALGAWVLLLVVVSGCLKLVEIAFRLGNRSTKG